MNKLRQFAMTKRFENIFFLKSFLDISKAINTWYNDRRNSDAVKKAPLGFIIGFRT